MATVRVIKKLTKQYVDPFCILEKVGRLAYKLDVPADWKIHPVFSVAQLKPAPPPALDPFSKLISFELLPVFVEGNTDTVKSFKVEKLLNKRLVKRGKVCNIEYLVRWKRYGPK